MPFRRAFDDQAAELADRLSITVIMAKGLVKDAYERETGKALNDWGAELDERHFRAKVEAERQEADALRRRRPTRRWTDHLRRSARPRHGNSGEMAEIEPPPMRRGRHRTERFQR